MAYLKGKQAMLIAEITLRFTEPDDAAAREEIREAIRRTAQSAVKWKDFLRELLCFDHEPAIANVPEGVQFTFNGRAEVAAEGVKHL